MRKVFETYEQFCTEQNKNILLEEHFSENGECSILCHHRHICQKEGCACLERLREGKVKGVKPDMV